MHSADAFTRYLWKHPTENMWIIFHDHTRSNANIIQLDEVRSDRAIIENKTATFYWAIATVDIYIYICLFHES